MDKILTRKDYSTTLRTMRVGRKYRFEVNNRDHRSFLNAYYRLQRQGMEFDLSIDFDKMILTVTRNK